MVIRNPASPTADGGLFGDRGSTTDEATTTDQSKGGLFSDTDGVGLDLSGVRGATGPEGPQGPAGPPGPQGQQGDTGATGAPGDSVDGVTGTLNTDMDQITLQFRVAGVDIPMTVQVPVLQGPMGLEGPEGAQGDTGPMGLQGAMGLQGMQGDQGLIGPVGPDGASVSMVSVTRSTNQTNIPVADFPDGGTRYDVTVTLSDGTVLPASPFIAATGEQGPPGPVGPAGGGVQTVESTDNTVTITPDPANNAVDLSVPGVGDATSIYDHPLPPEPVIADGDALILEYIPAAQTFEWVQVPSGISVDSSFIPNSTNPVQSQIIQTALDAKVNTDFSNIVVDTTPMDGSDRLVESGGVFTSIATKQDILPLTVPVEHQNDGFPTADNIADALDLVVADADLELSGGFVSGIRTGRDWQDTDPDSGTVNPIRQGALHIDQGDGITVSVEPTGNDRISARLAAAPNRIDIDGDGALVVNEYTQGTGITVDNDADTIAVRVGADSGLSFNTDGGLQADPAMVLRGLSSSDTTAFASPTAGIIQLNEGRDMDLSVSSDSILFSSVVAQPWSGTNGYQAGSIVSAGSGDHRQLYISLRVQNPQGGTLNPQTTNPASATRVADGNWALFQTPSTGTHDVDEFMPGWAYTYYDLENTVNRTGTVGNAVDAGMMIFSEGFFIRNGIRLIITQGFTFFNDGDRFAFRTYGPADETPAGETSGTRTTLFPGTTQDYIVYCQRTTSPTNTPEATILQIDPPVSTVAELAALFGETSGGGRRVFATPPQFTVFNLDEHHVTPTVGTYAWAHEGNDTPIPTDKLSRLSETLRDGQTQFVIDDSWLPTITTTLGGLDDVHITNPAVNNVIEYRVEDATATPPVPETGWYNVPLSMAQINLTQEDTTFPAGSQRVRITGGAMGEIDFIAFAPAGPSFSIADPSRTRALYSGGTAETESFIFTVTNADGGTVTYQDSDGNVVTSPYTITYNAEVVGTTSETIRAFVDGTEVLPSITISVEVTDQRSIFFSRRPPPQIDIASNVDLTFEVSAGANTQFSGFNETFNGVTSGQAGSSPVEGTITAAQLQAAGRGTERLTVTARTLRAPERDLTSLTADIRLYRAFFFWATADDFNSGPTPVTPPSTRFDDQVGNLEFGVGSVLRSGDAQSNYYLAYPTDLGLFSYMSSFGDSDGTTVSTTVNREGIPYTVVWFDGLLADMTLTVITRSTT